MDDNAALPQLSSPLSIASPPASTLVAPIWHTVVLVAGIIALSVTSAARIAAAHGPVHRIRSYAFTAGMELVLLLWVLLGLRLRRTSFRTVFGFNALHARSIALDIGIAFLFWIASMAVLVTVAIAWTVIASAVTHRPLIDPHGQPVPPSAEQKHAVETVLALAPENPLELAAWAALCVIAGFVEEAVFRGYLQLQFISFARGRIAVGLVASAILFGSAHAYEGTRSMFLIGVFGLLLGILALYRRSLRPGILAHAGHDLVIGLAAALIKSLHINFS